MNASTRACCLAVGASLWLGCSDDSARPGTASATAEPPATSSFLSTPEVGGGLNPRLLRRFQPLGPAMESALNPLTSAKITLGRQLFYERRLSATKDISCNSCHDLEKYGTDGERTSPGTRGQRGERNAPSVYNAAGQFAQFWDGRASDVEAQARVPILSPVEMGVPDGAVLVATLKRIPEYVASFRAAFPGEADPVTFDNAAASIAAFERRLVTPSRWDKFLAGDAGALTVPEKDGLRTFLNVGCMVCHTGPYLGGSMFERVGVVEPWPNQADPGRMAVTHAEPDRMMFKVPSLRNVEMTAPYFHDGSGVTLEDAVHKMGKHQLGLDLSAAEVSSVASWLRSLTGELPREYIARPELPPEPTAGRR